MQNFEEQQLAFQLMSQQQKKKKGQLNVVSLFSGCGGMDLGFEGGFKAFKASIAASIATDFIEEELNEREVLLKKTRFKTVFANDILGDAKKAWVEYFKKRGQTEATYWHASIVDLVKQEQAGAKVFPEDVDIVTGGFPCQDFSIAGKRKGFNSHKNHLGKQLEEATEETRGKLYMWMRSVVEICQPKIFIAENVKGLVNLANVKDIIQADFASIANDGYLVLDPQVLYAANYGVPQSRERVFFIGIKKSALKKEALLALSQEKVPADYSPYPKATHAHTVSGEELSAPLALKDFLSHLPEPEESTDLSQQYYSKAKFMGKHCQGQTEIKLHSIGPTIRAEHHGNIEFRRLSLEHAGQYNEEFKAGKLERRLTPRECAIIQSFPTDYEFVLPHPSGRKRSFWLSPSKAYKVIGNAVPPLLAYHIAKRIEKLWPIYFKD